MILSPIGQKTLDKVSISVFETLGRIPHDVAAPTFVELFSVIRRSGGRKIDSLAKQTTSSVLLIRT